MSKRNGRVTPGTKERALGERASRAEKMRGGGKEKKKKKKRERGKRKKEEVEGRIRLEMVPFAFVSLNRLSGD